MTLYELQKEFLDLYELADSGELDEETLKDTFEAVEGEFEAKADGYAKVMAQLKADAEAIQGEIDRLQSRKTALENNRKRMLNVLEMAMRAVNKPKFKTNLFSFGIQKNGGKKPLIIEEGITFNDVPPEFLKFKDPEIDNAMVREALEGGRELEWAHYGERGESLRIR